MKGRALVGLAVVAIALGMFVRSASAQIIGGTPEIAALQAGVSALQDQVAALQSQMAPLQNDRVTHHDAVMDLAPYVSVDPHPINGVAGPHVIFTGVNVHIRSGSGATEDDTTNLGNLIVGYNEPRGGTDTTN